MCVCVYVCVYMCIYKYISRTPNPEARSPNPKARTPTPIVTETIRYIHSPIGSDGSYCHAAPDILPTVR